MSSERLPPVVDLALGRSLALTLAFAVAYALGISAVCLSGLPWPLRIALAFGLAIFAVWWIFTRALRLGARSIRRFIWQVEGECEWQDRSGRYRRGELIPGMLVTPALVVVRLRTGRLRTRTLCIACDAVDPEAFRSLRMRLTISPPPASPTSLRRLRTRLGTAIARRHA